MGHRARNRIGWALLLSLLVVKPLLARVDEEKTLDRAYAAYERGDLAAAAEAFGQAARLATEDSARALSLNNACLVLNDLGRFAESTAVCSEAVELRRSLVANPPPESVDRPSPEEEGADPGNEQRERLSRALNNLAVAFQGGGRANEAIPILEEALALNQDLGDWDGAIANLTNLSLNHQVLGDFATSEKQSQSTLDLCHQHSGEDWASGRCALAAINRATLLERLGRYRDSLDLLDGVLNDPDLPITIRSGAELNRGVIYRNLGDPVAASQALQASARLFRSMSSKGGEASARLNIAITQHRNLHSPTAALETLVSSRKLAAAAGDAELLVEVENNLGRVLLDLGRADEARQTFLTALELSKASGSGVGLWSSLSGLGAVDRAEGEHSAARENLNQALNEIERQSRDLAFQSSTSFLAERRQVYEAAIALEIERTDSSTSAVESSFEIVQRFKARSLADALGQGSATKPATVEQVAPKLGDATLIEYFEVEGRLMAFVVSGTTTISPTPVDLGPSRPIADAVGRISKSLVQGVGLLDEDLAFLGRQLLTVPLGAAAIETSKTPFSFPERLLLAPDGFLWFLPFDLLPIDLQPADSELQKRRSLLEASAIRLVPSANSLVSLATLTTRDYAWRFEGWTLDPATSAELGLESLANSTGELRRAASMIGEPTRLLVGSEASEPALRSDSSGAAIRHFATHTQVDAQAGLTSAVVLARSRSKATLPNRDGQLTPLEISRLDLPAELTVLAACTTLGEAGDAGDQALATLSSAFLAAGSRSVLATLWDVDDQSSAVLLEQFYYQLARGKSADLALRLAKLEMVEDPRWSDPYRWAGWVLIGEAPRLPVGRIWLRSLLTLLAAGVSLLLWWLMRRADRRPRLSSPD